MQLDDFTSSAAALASTVADLRRRIEALERARPVPGVLPLKLVPSWYQAATGSPEPPITEEQLRRWVSRPAHFKVDWIVRRGRAVFVDCERLAAWLRRPTPARPKKEATMIRTLSMFLALSLALAVPVAAQEPVFTTSGRVVEIVSEESAGSRATLAGTFPEIRFPASSKASLSVRAGDQLLAFAFKGSVSETGLGATVQTVLGPVNVVLGDRVLVRFRIQCKRPGVCALKLLEVETQ